MQTVIDVNNEKIVTAATRDGLKQYKAKAVVLTMGCRERTRGAISTPGTRPAGIIQCWCCAKIHKFN